MSISKDDALPGVAIDHDTQTVTAKVSKAPIKITFSKEFLEDQARNGPLAGALGEAAKKARQALARHIENRVFNEMLEEIQHPIHGAPTAEDFLDGYDASL